MQHAARAQPLAGASIVVAVLWGRHVSAAWCVADCCLPCAVSSRLHCALVGCDYWHSWEKVNDLGGKVKGHVWYSTPPQVMEVKAARRASVAAAWPGTMRPPLASATSTLRMPVPATSRGKQDEPRGANTAM